MSSLPPGYDDWRCRPPGDGPDDPLEEAPLEEQTHEAQDELVTCIGCGCDDFDACEAVNGGACHWLRVDDTLLVGVCSECPEHVERFDNGSREFSAEVPAPAREESLLLPGDVEYSQTLSYLRDRTPPR
ncbi:MAG: hypothetical protein ACYDAE_19585 [Steroidobacteraceae bacterium]